MAEALEARIARVLEKLKDFRQCEPTRCKQERHGFRLGPPLPEAQISGFEQSVGIRLPEAYRQFLLQAGDGGAGPAYGLFAFSRWSQDALRVEKYHGAGYLAKPCPTRPRMPLCVDDEDRNYFIWDDLLVGTLRILHAGCSDSVVLIVTGKYRGRVVHVDDEQDGGPYMTRDIDFLAWYERWLDAVCWGWDVKGFGPGLPGDMAHMLEVLRDSRSPHEDLEEALNTIQSAPTIIEGMEPLVVNLLQSPAPSVRHAAAVAVEKHRPEAAVPHLRHLLQDRNTDIRRATVYALRSIRAEGWIEDLRPMLKDADHGVMFPALGALIDGKALRPEDLRPLIVSDLPENRRSGLYAWGKSGLSMNGESWMDARMNDEDSMVRYEFLRAAELSRPSNLKQIVSAMKERHPDDPWFPKPIVPLNIGGLVKSLAKTSEFVGAYLVSQMKKWIWGRK